jgi:hypothetical protein
MQSSITGSKSDILLLLMVVVSVGIACRRRRALFDSPLRLKPDEPPLLPALSMAPSKADNCAYNQSHSYT